MTDDLLHKPITENLSFNESIQIEFQYLKLIENMRNDPEFIAQCEKNNQTWEEGVSEHLECTVDELRHFLDTSLLLQEFPLSTNNND
jgi:hypothetical protein